ncbi:UNVERIFIED_CONTAM: Retrovirus-related Pol polyprotein from type-2 retrotransposable element R2DM [Sesamum latifolium]|uniref:Retrovirus-related Pol polyprotein from type-2 retrotransposable element R2DM n=1 Tax=Sesamum latifolium TaxID=2727402 RepID=A0AAW2XAP8_9LAMI
MVTLSGFFKAAWPIIGDEVTKAVQDFFASGKLLRQINATLITLIPKVASPAVVGEFRPISCCNVIYKVIKKVIVQRLQLVLSKIESPTQNAFVPGRRISNNILLAQELFSGYNRRDQPPRCAMKVDLRKAYDMLEWDFIISALTYLGFLLDLFHGLRNALRLAHSRSLLMANYGVFFPGARGIRQGDPMSPYLFVIAMEVLHLLLTQRVDQSEDFRYHWHCEKIGLVNLCFADDLLLFCRAEIQSVQLFRDALMIFVEWSGLEANPSKSQLIVSKAARDMRQHLLNVLGFQEGTLPVRYLGVPLISSRLMLGDSSPLLNKVDERLNGWGKLQLSFVARVQLLRSVISSLNTHWAMAFVLPKGVIRDIEARMRKFLWHGNSSSGMAKVAWKDVCKPIEGGGQGIRALEPLNRALMSQHFWSVVTQNQNSVWVTWVVAYRLKMGFVWTVSTNTRSWSWRKIIRLRNQLLGRTNTPS